MKNTNKKRENMKKKNLFHHIYKKKIQLTNTNEAEKIEKNTYSIIYKKIQTTKNTNKTKDIKKIYISSYIYKNKYQLLSFLVYSTQTCQLLSLILV